MHLNAQSGARPEWDDTVAMFKPGKPTQAQFSAGGANGTLDLAGCLREGAQASVAAMKACGFKPKLAVPSAEQVESEAILPLWNLPSHFTAGRGPKAFIDMQNDVGAADIQLAVREGFQSVEHV